ncbi:MAG TPA: hypothetical protein VLT88_14655, partial [Desulfosarcina sp.]|nr:hypothetical protein [Desulfosarcina sp.]
MYLYLLSLPSRTYPLPDNHVGQKLTNASNQALAAMLLLNARRKPTILVLDDWHWVDEASDSSLMHLAGSMENYPLMLLVIYRPERAEGWPDWHFRTSCVLKALDGRHTERIIRSNWKVDALPEGFAAFIHDHTGGNPLFIEEVSRTLTEDGSVRIAGQQALLLNPAEQLKLPATVQAVIRARLDRLDRHVKETLQLAAVIGRKFGVGILQRLSGVGPALPGALAVLQSQGLIQQTGPVPETEYTFKHALTQVTVYESLLVKRRRAVHTQIARILERMYAGRLEKQCENIAYHYANSTAPAKALFYLEMAGGKAARVHSLAEARRYFETALDIFGAKPLTGQEKHRYIDFALQWAEVSQYAPSNRIRNALVQSLEYARASDATQRTAEVSYWVGKFGYMQGDFVDAIPRIEDSIRLAERLNDRRLLALSTNLYGRACLYTGDLAKGIRRLNQGLALIDPFDAWDDIVYSTAILGMMQGLSGNFKESLQTIARAIRTARRHEIPTFEAMAFGYLG